MKVVFAVTAAAFILCVIVICVFIFARSVPAIGEIGLFEFLFSTEWAPNNTPASYGIGTMIVGTCFVTAGALVIGVPIGLLMAAFMARYCPKPLYKVMKPMTNILAGIPVHRVRLFRHDGHRAPHPRQFRRHGIQHPHRVHSAGASLILPTVIGVSESALRALPNTYYEGALALGATHERAVFMTEFPAARSGILTSVVLGLGRVVGETMAVVMIVGNSTALPTVCSTGVRP